jgi:hypothetical protein
MAEVGALHATLGLNSAQFEEGLKRASNAAGNFGNRINTGLAGANRSFQAVTNGVRGLVAALAVGQIIRFANSVLQSTAALGELSQSTGISVERLSALKFAAEQTGIEFEVLQQAAKGFSQRLAEGLGDSGSGVSLALRTLGLSARDAQGNIKNLADFLPEAADKFQGMADGVGKAQLATALFGEEAGPKLIPLLNKGSQGIEALTAKAREFGAVIDQDAVRSAKDYRVALTSMQGALESIARELIALTAGPAAAVLQTLAGMLQKFNELKKSTDASAQSLADVEVRLAELQSKLAELNAKWTIPGTQGWLLQQEAIKATSKEIDALVAKLNDPTRLSASPVFRAPEVNSDDLAKAKERVELLRNEAAIFQQIAAGQRTILEDLNMAFMSHADVVAEAQRKIQAAYGNTVQAQIQMANITRSLQIQYEQQVAQTAQKVGAALVAVFPKSKAAAIAQATINTAVGVTEALKAPFPLNFIQAAAVFAAGVAQVAAIRSTNVGGGGNVPAPSGGGGGGATPTTTAPASSFGNSLTIELEGAELYSGEQLARLIERINGAVKNGTQLISTTTTRNRRV